MIRRPGSTITITATDVESLEELKRKLDEENAQRTALEAFYSKELERDSFLIRTKDLDQKSRTQQARQHHAPSSSSDFLSKRRRMATEAASASQRQTATLERTGNVTHPSLKRARQT